jgi:hypothetical protein
MLLVLQSIVTAILFLSIIAVAIKFKIKVTIHNFPKIVMSAVGVLAGMYLCVKHFIFFVPPGLLLGAVIFGLNSLDIPGEVKPSLFRRILSFVIVTLFWNQTLALLLFVYSNEISSNNEKL